jgi:hypothetical protein
MARSLPHRLSTPTDSVKTWVARLRLPLDTRERHAVAARFVGHAETVLDVGGVQGLLALFLPSGRITTVNVEPPADMLFDGDVLPFADRTFAAAVSLDVLEHLPRERRRAHLAELARVADQRVVLCCPLGSGDHVAAEQATAAWYASVTGRRHRFLEEHLEHGLPTEAELRALTALVPYSFEIAFHGDFRRTDELFRLGVLARNGFSVRNIGAFARRRLGLRADVALASSPALHTNRVFLVGNRER